MESEERELARLHQLIADRRGVPVETIAAMTIEEMRDETALMSINTFALTVAYGHDRSEVYTLMDEGPDEQAERVVTRLLRLHEHRPLWPIHDPTHMINLWGFGGVQVHYVVFGDDGNAEYRYVLLSELAEALGVHPAKADRWLQMELNQSLQAQREKDEERGELGWECVFDVVDLGLSLIADDPEAKPDAGGLRWSHASDALVEADRLLSFMTVSPWQEEFMKNSSALWGHAFRHAFGDKLADSPVYDSDGNVIPGKSGLDFLGDTEGLSPEEAAKRALKGPSFGNDAS